MTSFIIRLFFIPISIRALSIKIKNEREKKENKKSVMMKCFKRVETGSPSPLLYGMTSQALMWFMHAVQKW